MTDLIVRPQNADIGMDLMTLGQTLAKSGYFQDTRDAAQAIVKILAGREMGIGPIAAMTGINLIKNRVSMSANLIAAQIKRSGHYDYRVLKLDDTGCELAFFERQGANWLEVGKSSFDEADAKAAGLTNSDNYRKFPRNMYFSRALTNGARWYTPDVFGGSPVYSPEELGTLEAAPVVTQAGPVDVTSGEIVEEQPGIQTLIGITSNVEAAYTKSGKLTMKFTLAIDDVTTHTVIVVGAPDIAAQMENGDSVEVTGEPKLYKGQEVFWGSAIAHTNGQSVWDERAAESATFTPVEPAL